ncbi:chaperonin 10-like protein [Lyophyllum atratum]|nr:chaperonin 10-like protein [Lyophyllum atratum]
MRLRTFLFSSTAIILSALLYKFNMSANTNTQKALLLESKQGRFVVDTRPIPKPGPDELLVKVLATALNPVDWKIQKYGAFINDFPAVLGTDGAGEVQEVGEGVTAFSKGDKVVFQGTFDSDEATFQQFTITDAATTAKIPATLSVEEASTIPVALTAAYVGLYNSKPYGLELAWPLDPSNRGKYSGTPIVILGGASSVGQYAIQLAKLSGFSPIIATASPKHTDYLKSLGATHILDRNLPTASLQASINKLTNAPITIVYDAISSKTTQQTGHDLLVPGGHLITVLNLAITKSEEIGHIQVGGILRLPQNQVLLRALYGKMTGLFEEGAIKPNRYEVLPEGLQGIVGGLQRLQEDKVSGVKLVALPWGA